MLMVNMFIKVSYDSYLLLVETLKHMSEIIAPKVRRSSPNEMADRGPSIDLKDVPDSGPVIDDVLPSAENIIAKMVTQFAAALECEKRIVHAVEKHNNSIAKVSENGRTSSALIDEAVISAATALLNQKPWQALQELHRKVLLKVCILW